MKRTRILGFAASHSRRFITEGRVSKAYVIVKQGDLRRVNTDPACTKESTEAGQNVCPPLCYGVKQSSPVVASGITGEVL